jgi:hypothetical protein
MHYHIISQPFQNLLITFTAFISTLAASTSIFGTLMPLQELTGTFHTLIFVKYILTHCGSTVSVNIFAKVSFDSLVEVAVNPLTKVSFKPLTKVPYLST